LSSSWAKYQKLFGVCRTLLNLWESNVGAHCMVVVVVVVVVVVMVEVV
jgi:hypothetical protein